MFFAENLSHAADSHPGLSPLGYDRDRGIGPASADSIV
jgi:hypothetical protein